MKPTRSEAHKAFIRSLPCLIPQCRSRFTVAAHAPGSRGMGQKRSDLETVPMCNPHHREQHRIGWKAFIEKYDLDIQGLIVVLTVKPRIFTMPEPWPRDHYWLEIPFGSLLPPHTTREVWRLSRTELGLKTALRLAQEHRREWLIENVFRPSQPPNALPEP